MLLLSKLAFVGTCTVATSTNRIDSLRPFSGGKKGQ